MSDNNIEKEFKELEEILEKINNDNQDLDFDIKLYKRANDIYKSLHKKLEDYKSEIKLVEDKEEIDG